MKRHASTSCNRSPHFLVGGVHFGNHNVGDEAILEGVVNVLRKVRPNCEITVLTDQPHRTAKTLGVKAFNFRFIYSRPGKINRVFRILSRVTENLLHAHLALRSDIVICAGATILSDSPGTIIRLASLGIFANKRLVHFPGGMNPENSPNTLNKLLAMSKQFDLFMVRDLDTKNRLVDSGFNTDFIHVTVDPAFNIPLSSELKEDKAKIPWLDAKMYNVGIGISHEPDCAEYNRPHEWAKIADFIVKNFDAHVVFLPSNTQSGKDIVVMKEVHRAMRYKEMACVVNTEWTPRSMISAISRLAMIVSSRMHQLIFSSLANTPFVGISRSAKTDNFLAFFDMVPAATVKDCSLEKVRPALEATWKNRDQVRETITRKRELLLHKASETEGLFAVFVNNINATAKPRRSLLKRCRGFSDAFFARY